MGRQPRPHPHHRRLHPRPLGPRRQPACHFARALPAPAPSPVPPAEHRPGPSLQLRTPGHSHVAWPGQTRLPLPASATDPEPGPSPLITAWRVLDGPSPVELVDTPTGPEAVFSGPGLHRLAFSATDGAETAQEIIEIIVAPDAFIPPAASGVVNVKDAPYLAVGDGRTDDTAALQRALDAYPNGNRIIYLPPGDYLISDTLRWPLGRSGGEREKRTILQGASRELSRLILADHSPAYADPAAPRAMVHTGLAPAQRFRNAVRNLTLHTGRGNPGAIGLQFNASNQGGLRDVAILSGDGLGLIGLDLSYTDEIGPLYVKNLLVRGFDYGVKTAYTVNSLTFEHLVLEQQRVAGFHNTHQVVTVRELHSRNRVPAIHNAGSTGVFTLLDSLLEAPSPDAPAIINEGFLYVLRSRTHGHGAALDQRTATPLTLPDGALAEFSSHPSLDRFPPRSPADARLPVHSAPTPPWPSRSEWTSLSDHATPEAFDLGALQAALDSGARAIAVPGGVAYTLEGRATIPTHVERITGFEGSFRGQLELVVAPLPPGASPTPLIIERLRAGAGHSVRILHRSERPVLVSSCEGVLVVGQGPGEFFVEDLSSASADFEYPGQPVFLRQYNPETQERVKIRNHGAHLWILGLKTERGHTVIETTRGGITELYGAHVYATSKPKTHPMFTVDSPSSLFLAGVGETAFSQGGHPYHELVAETRGQDTRLLRREDAPRRGQASVILRYDGRP